MEGIASNADLVTFAMDHATLCHRLLRGHVAALVGVAFGSAVAPSLI